MKKTPLRRISRKKRAQIAEYTVAKKKYFDDLAYQQALEKDEKPFCEVCCAKKAVDIHHIHSLGTGGARSDESNMLAVCKMDHYLIHFGATTVMRKDAPWYKEWSEFCGSEIVYYGTKWARYFNYLK